MRFLIFMLMSGAAFAQAPPPGAPPPPPQNVVDDAINYIRSDRQVLDAVIRSAAVRMATQSVAPTAPIAATPAASAAVPAIPTIVVSPSAGFNLPPELQADIQNLIITLISIAVSAAVLWLRSHIKTVQHDRVMEEVGANSAITNAQKSAGGGLELIAAKQGKSLTDLDYSDPLVQTSAQRLRESFPEWAKLVGLTQDIAARKVLDSAVEQSTSPIAVAPTVAVVPPPVPVVEDKPLKPGDIS